MNFLSTKLEVIHDLVRRIPSSIFKAITTTSSLIYKFVETVATELFTLDNQSSNVNTQIYITSATEKDLDTHAQSFLVNRFEGEGDKSLRERILSVFLRPKVTKSAIKRNADFLTGYDTPIEEYMYDRWFVGGDVFSPPTREKVFSIDKNTIAVSGANIEPTTAPDIWLVADWENPDIERGKTFNYGYQATINGNIILTQYSLPSTKSEVYVDYVQEGTGRDIRADWKPHGFLCQDTILRNRNCQHNCQVITLSTTGLMIHTSTVRTSAGLVSSNRWLEGLPIEVASYDSDSGLLYQWEDSVDENGYIEIGEHNRTDSHVSNEKIINDSIYTIETNLPISRVVSVKLESGNKNYATSNNFNNQTIFLDEALPGVGNIVVVDYYSNPISDYVTSSFNLTYSSVEDPKYTIEVHIYPNFYKWGSIKYGNSKKYGEFAEQNLNKLGEVLNEVKAAGIRIKILLAKYNAVYGKSLYAFDYYGDDLFLARW